MIDTSTPHAHTITTVDYVRYAILTVWWSNELSLGFTAEPLRSLLLLEWEGEVAVWVTLATSPDCMTK